MISCRRSRYLAVGLTALLAGLRVHDRQHEDPNSYRSSHREHPANSSPADCVANPLRQVPRRRQPQRQLATPTISGPGGGTIYLLKDATDFDYYDPQRIYTPEDQAFFGATIMRSLVAYKYSSDPAEANTLVPDMATDIGTANADATSWTFTLRDGLTWQDGSPVKCEDIKYGVSRTFATDVINGGPLYANEYLNIPRADDGTSQYKGPYSYAEGQDLFDQAVICNGTTITFNLNTTVPDFNFATTLGFGAVQNPIDHPGVDTAENYAGDAVWSDGPYQITTYTPNDGGSLILDRNPNWNPASDDYRGAYPDKWEVDFGLDPEDDDTDHAVHTGPMHSRWTIPNCSQIPFPVVFGDSRSPLPAFEGRAFSGSNSRTSYIWINTETVPSRDIRAAMAATLDREAMRQSEGGDFVGEFADGAINPSIGMDYAPTGLWNTLLGQPIPPAGDPGYAKTLIDQSGVAAPALNLNDPFGPTQQEMIAKQSLERAGFQVQLTQGQCHSTVCPPDTSNFGVSLYCGSWRADYPTRRR